MLIQCPLKPLLVTLKKEKSKKLVVFKAFNLWLKKDYGLKILVIVVAFHWGRNDPLQIHKNE